MAIFETFSKRQKKLKGEFVPDVFIYDVPTKLRVQICHIWGHAFGIENGQYLPTNPIYREMEQTLAAEFGLFDLSQTYDGRQAIVDFFMNGATNEQALDMIEMSFRMLLDVSRNYRWRDTYYQRLSAEEAVFELNQRFLENAVGYTFVDGQLIRKDNEHLHKEAVLPALRLLHEEGFDGANEEYRHAHEHYRNGKYDDCLNDCLKAFESTMKTICKKQGWVFKPTDTASPLIDVCLKNGLLPPFMQAHLGAVKAVLETAIPTVRNKLGGHGQGAVPLAVPRYFAEYLLHDTAATIVLLIEAYKALK